MATVAALAVAAVLGVASAAAADSTPRAWTVSEARTYITLVGRIGFVWHDRVWLLAGRVSCEGIGRPNRGAWARFECRLAARQLVDAGDRRLFGIKVVRILSRSRAATTQPRLISG